MDIHPSPAVGVSLLGCQVKYTTPSRPSPKVVTKSQQERKSLKSLQSQLRFPFFLISMGCKGGFLVAWSL